MFKDGDKISLDIRYNTVEGILVYEDGEAYLVHNDMGFIGSSPSNGNMRGYEYGWALGRIEERMSEMRIGDGYGDWSNLQMLVRQPSYGGSILKFKMK